MHMQVSEYADEFPVEMRECITKIDTDTHFAILTALTKSDNKSFAELYNTFDDVEQAELRTTLTSLQQAGMIKRIEQGDETPYNTYEITTLGEQLLTNILDVFTSVTAQ